MSRLPRARDARGFSLVELVVGLGIMSIVLAGVAQSMDSAMRAHHQVSQVTGMNTNLRVAMDLIVRDLIQAGQGLPAGLVVTVPSGAGALPIVRPSRNGTNLTFDTPGGALPAVSVGPDLGPEINGQPTDMITILSADNAFDEVPLTQLTSNQMIVHPSVDITDLPDQLGDNIRVGDLILLEKASVNVLKYVTGVNGQVVTFSPGDPLRLNQVGTADGTLAQYVASAPAETTNAQGIVPSRATRVRMISYYVETPVDRARDMQLVRRVNANPGTTVAFFIESFRITYDLVDGVLNPANVRMTAADLSGNGACDSDHGSAPFITCSPNQIRKVNVRLAGRSAERHRTTGAFYRNVLSTQVSLRSMALVNRYL